MSHLEDAVNVDLEFAIQCVDLLAHLRCQAQDAIIAMQGREREENGTEVERAEERRRSFQVVPLQDDTNLVADELDLGKIRAARVDHHRVRVACARLSVRGYVCARGMTKVKERHV